jgi:two-component system cell cycle sensor histidine kinase/response regulator CckA
MTERTSGDRTLAELLVQNSVDGLAAVDREYRYMLWNRAMEQFAGKRADEVLGRSAFEVFPFLREIGLDVAIDRALAGEAVAAEAVPNHLPDGSRRYYDRFYLPLRDNDAAIIGVLAIVRDVTARQKAEDALRANEEQLRLAVEAAGLGLWSWDMRTGAVKWEEPMCALFGLPAGSAPTDCEQYLAMIHPDDRERSTERILRGIAAGHWDDEYRIVRPDGTVRWAFAKGSVVGDVALGAALDVTARREREEQLRQAQKLEAVGQLTAGIAHNFNNMLMGMLANLESAVRRAPPDLEPLLRDAEQSARRAAHLVRQLMTYAGRNAPALRGVESVAALVERTVALCRTTFDQRIVFDARYDGFARARVDSAQFEQALLNVLINARDALADVEAPRITVSVDIVLEGAAELGPRTGDYVRVQVGDNGTGVDAAMADRIFEPFFTTKPMGKGTGLGLATTRAIVVEHGGFLTCDSAPRQGAKFSLYFPRESRAADTPRPLAAPVSVSGTETVLVVDDEALIRRAVQKMLTRAGFKAKLAGSGDEALRLLTDADVVSELALVILDVSMPGMSGPELRNHIRVLAPRVRILYFSGYAFEAHDVGDAVLEKPATEAQFLSKVREVLDLPAQGHAPRPAKQR